jgi:hypothetical protein
MASEPQPAPDHDPDLIAYLTVEVSPAFRSERWAWQLIDRRSGSWFESGHDYESQMDARRAALARLAELTPSLPGAKVGARIPSPSANRHLIIVSRGHDGLYGLLGAVFAGSEGIGVIRDRRRPVPEPQRRATDRRLTRIDPLAEARGWWVVSRSDSELREESA